MLFIDRQNFKKEVLESPVPVLVHFTTPWCGLCRAIEPLLINWQNRWGDNVRLVAINPDRNFTLAKAYNLTNLPTVILFEDGQAVSRLEGFASREEFSRALDKLPLGYLVGSTCK